MVRRILIVSDSHGNNNIIRTLIQRERPDMLIHLGDIENDPEKIREWLDQTGKEAGYALPVPAVFIRGNCDWGEEDLKSNAIFEVNGYRFFCTHGHRQGVSFGVENLAYSALENGCDFALYGHTHIPFDEEWEGVRILNPGSIHLPRGGSLKSYMIMSFDDRGAYEVELKEYVK